MGRHRSTRIFGRNKRPGVQEATHPAIRVSPERVSRGRRGSGRKLTGEEAATKAEELALQENSFPHTSAAAADYSFVHRFPSLPSIHSARRYLIIVSIIKYFSF